jgi:hypothetical protein
MQRSGSAMLCGQRASRGGIEPPARGFSANPEPGLTMAHSWQTQSGLDTFLARTFAKSIESADDLRSYQRPTGIEPILLIHSRPISHA